MYLSAFSLVIQMMLPTIKRKNQANANAEAPADDTDKEGGEQA